MRPPRGAGRRRPAAYLVFSETSCLSAAEPLDVRVDDVAEHHLGRAGAVATTQPRRSPRAASASTASSTREAADRRRRGGPAQPVRGPARRGPPARAGPGAACAACTARGAAPARPGARAAGAAAAPARSWPAWRGRLRAGPPALAGRDAAGAVAQPAAHLAGGGVAVARVERQRDRDGVGELRG